LKDEEIIKDFQRELKLPTADGRRQIDFKIVCGNESLIWEIKALCISRAGGTPRNLAYYFRNDHVGLFKDFRKLDSIPEGNKLVIGFIYPSATEDQLKEVCRKFPGDLGHWRFEVPDGCSSGHLMITIWEPSRSEGPSGKSLCCS
jgi:hypothetical protein